MAFRSLAVALSQALCSSTRGFLLAVAGCLAFCSWTRGFPLAAAYCRWLFVHRQRGCLLAVACCRWSFAHGRAALRWLLPVADGFALLDAGLFACCRWLFVRRRVAFFAGCRLWSTASRSSKHGFFVAIACCRWLLVHRRVALCWLSPVVDCFSFIDAWLFDGHRLCLLPMAFLVVGCCLLSMACYTSTRVLFADRACCG